MSGYIQAAVDGGGQETALHWGRDPWDPQSGLHHAVRHLSRSHGGHHDRGYAHNLKQFSLKRFCDHELLKMIYWVSNQMSHRKWNVWGQLILCVAPNKEKFQYMASEFAMFTCRGRQEWGFWAERNGGERKLTIFSAASARRTDGAEKSSFLSRPGPVPVTTRSLLKQTCEANKPHCQWIILNTRLPTNQTPEKFSESDSVLCLLCVFCYFRGPFIPAPSLSCGARRRRPDRVPASASDARRTASALFQLRFLVTAERDAI